MATVTEPERVDVAYSLIVDPETEQILIVGYREGGWSLPGGAREPGETLAETAIRETMEEAGVVLAVERLIAVGERLPTPHSGPKDHAVFFLFCARIIDGTPTVTDDDEIVRFKWVDAQEANDLLSYWQMDFAVHHEYRAFYYAAEWEERD
jgi:8-oxo-dGTP diphosphatase